MGGLAKGRGESHNPADILPLVRRSRVHWRPISIRVLASIAALVMLVSVAAGTPSAALPADSTAAPLRTWTAQIGNYPSVGANGAALLTMDADGGGTLQLNLRRLLRGTTYPLALFLGRWMPPGTSWSARGDGCVEAKLEGSFPLPSAKTSAAGTIVSTLHVTATQLRTLNKTARRLALSVGIGRIARCGSLALHLPGSASAGSPTPSPPTPSPTPPPCSAWPDPIPQITTALSTPPDLCLRIYTDPATTPEFVRDSGGIYVPDPPTASYLIGTTKPLGDELHVLLHELCHAHQDEAAQEAGWPPLIGWVDSAAGGTYVEAAGWQNWVDHWVSTIPAPWGTAYASPIEENADLCAFWFDPRNGPPWVHRVAPDRYAWAEQWLPQPDFPPAATALQATSP